MRTVKRHDYAALDRLQQSAMSTLAGRTALNQVYTPAELESIASNERVVKVLVWDGGAMVGFGALTDDLDGLVQFNADFFRGLYPEEAARGTIWYAVAGLVDPRYWSSGVLTTLGEQLAEVLAANGGEIVLWDLVDALYDKQGAWMDRLISTKFGPGAKHEQIDTQRWMATRLPTAPTQVEIDLRER